MENERSFNESLPTICESFYLFSLAQMSWQILAFQVLVDSGWDFCQMPCKGFHGKQKIES